MPHLVLLSWLRRCYLVIQMGFGVVLIFDPSPDNRFMLAGLNFSNVGLGAIALLVTVWTWRKHPPFWTLPTYLAPIFLLSIQRVLFIISEPTRAKVAIPVYLMALIPLIIVALWAYAYGANDTNGD